MQNIPSFAIQWNAASDPQNGYCLIPTKIWMLWKDQITTVTLQTKYDFICASKSCMATRRNIPWIWSLFRHGQPLLADTETTGQGTVKAGSRESHDQNHDAPSFTEFRNLYCPRTIQLSLWQRVLLRKLPTLLIVSDWKNNDPISVSTCAARCHLLQFSSVTWYFSWFDGRTSMDFVSFFGGKRFLD